MACGSSHPTNKNLFAGTPAGECVAQQAIHQTHQANRVVNKNKMNAAKTRMPDQNALNASLEF
jgi:hypothetical protein